MTARIRHAVETDVPALQRIVADTDLFPPEMVPDAVAASLTGDEDAGAWFVAVEGDTDTVLGLAWARPEPLTERTWNLVALGVAPAARRGGAALALLTAVREHVRARGGRPLLVETSSLPGYAAARALYARAGFVEVAVVPDYWAPGDDKVVLLDPG